VSTREAFDSDVVRREMRVIRGDLHCNAVRITGGDAVEWDGARPIRLNGEYVRDEVEQVTYLRELLDVFEAAGVDTAFVNTFASYHLPHRDDPRRDLDMASFGLVKVLEHGRGETYPGMPWEPRAAFAAAADRYRD
jgi:hypothetical protein